MTIWLQDVGSNMSIALRVDPVLKCLFRTVSNSQRLIVIEDLGSTRACAIKHLYSCYFNNKIVYNNEFRFGY
jgi:hypothetical protein